MAIGSFSAGLSGLAAHAMALNVIGNNLANINTIGYKASSVNFQDLVSQTVGSSSGITQIGLGVVTGAVRPLFTQGSIENSQEPTNVAIQGNGLFVVRNDEGVAYTRAGNFSFNNNGELVTTDGFKVQGYTQIDPATGQVITTGEPTDIVVPAGVLRPPVATTQFQITSNLDATAANGAEFTSSIQIYDSLGAPHVLTVTYTKTGNGAWGYEVTVPGAEVNPAPAAGAPQVLAAGTLAFNASGQITTITPTAPSTGGGSTSPGPIADVQFAGPTWANGATPGTLTWDVVDASQIVSLTSFSSASSTGSKSQNGAPPGLVDSIAIAEDGSIMATFGAGQTVTVAQLALATFNNPAGLVKLGANKWGESLAAGVANVGVAGTGGRGTFTGAALEQSNVDIAHEFTQMILAQRGYQANSKTITVADELLVDTLNIKR